MKKFSTIRKIYEADEVVAANLPQVDQQPETVIDQTGKLYNQIQNHKKWKIQEVQFHFSLNYLDQERWLIFTTYK